MSKSQVEIVQNAKRLAANLQAGPVVTKNALLSVVATFMSDPSADLARLRRTMTLLEKGSGGHLKRGSGFGDQVRLVLREVSRLLDREEWNPGELKSLFGWTSRLLQVRQAPPAHTQRPEPRGRQSGEPPAPQQYRRGTPPSGLGGLKKSVLSTLQQLRERLDEESRKKDRS